MSTETLDNDLEDYYSDYGTVQILSPCSSCATAVYDGLESSDSSDSTSTPPDLVIQLPNLCDNINIQIQELETFVGRYTSSKHPLLVIHLLIYLYYKKPVPNINHISDLKLLHMGKQYSIIRDGYRQWDKTPLHSITSSFNKFQMLVAPNPSIPPVDMSIQQLVQRSVVPREEVAVTYADAMIRKIKKASRKRSSSNGSNYGVLPFRSSSVDSTTDVEENPSTKLPQKLRSFSKRMIRRVAVK